MKQLYPAPVRPRAETLLAWAAAAVGAIGIVSAWTPEFADRMDAVRGVLPPGAPTAARFATFAFGIALIWLARSLARRRRRAWQLAVALVLAISLAHLAKGLDVEEAASALVVLAALIRYRRRFDVPGDPAALRPFLATACALAAAGGLTLWLDLHTGFDRVGDVLGAASVVLAFYALHLWLRPLSARVLQTVEERRAAGLLVDAYGRDSLAFFTLRRDKSYLFSKSGRAFLAYRVVSGTVLISGDPVGDDEELDELMHEVRRLARANGWRVAVLGASAGQLERYKRLGMRAIKLGDEAVLRAEDFTLEGRSVRKVRQSVARLERAGYRFGVTAAGDIDTGVRAQLAEVSELWRGSQPERGFTMAHDDLYAPDTLVAFAEDADGRIGGFLHLVPTPAAGGYSLSAMRRRPGTPNGLMEFLIARTLAWASEHEVPEVSLNFCVFTDFLRPEANGWRRCARAILLALDRLFQLERLYSFNRKFFPEWRPRYLCLERISDLPVVGLAYLRVESLLVPPGPWTTWRSSRTYAKR
jgi:lysyl-tRNA synthetase class 2